MKRLILLIFCCALGVMSFAQQNLYKWRLGVHGGIGTYYGDLSTPRFIDPQSTPLKFWESPENLSYGLSLEYSMNRAWGLRLMSTHGAFEGNSRATKWNGDLYTENAETFAKALNFRTTYHDLDLMFVYQFDNGKLLSEKSFFAPYFGAGLGFMNYKVKGDLFLDDGRRYYYWSDNTIRDLAENDPFAGNANIIEQDGEFETDLRELESEGKSYGKSTMTIPLAMGLKFRLGNRFNLNLETLLHYSFSDYLDDVSGDYPTDFTSPTQAYASNPSNYLGTKRGADNKMKDIYGTFNLSLGFNFGYKKQAFNAPIFYLGESDPIGSPPITSPSPKREENTSDNSTTIEPTTKDTTEPIVDLYQDYSEYYLQDTFEYYTEPVYIINKDTVVIDQTDTIKNQTYVIDNITVNQLFTDTIVEGRTQIIRDTVYETGTIIKEKVIIRTDTIREIIQENKTIIETPYNGEKIIIDDRSGYIEPLEMESAEIVWETAELDTLIVMNPATQEEETFFVIDDNIVVEPVPEEPIYTLVELETVTLDELDGDYFIETVGYLEDDLSKEEVLLSEIQESNFELIALRNEINELKSKEDKSQADIDAIYDKLEEISNEFRVYDGYNSNLAIQASDEHTRPENVDIRTATSLLEQDLSDVRREIIYLESSNTSSISRDEYDIIRKENEKRIAALEKDMRKLRKKVRRSNRPDLVNENYLLKDKEKNKDKKETTTSVSTQPVVIPTGNPIPDSYYRGQINTLEQELARIKNANSVSNTQKDTEIKNLKSKLADLERRMNAQQNTGNSDARTLEYISKLEQKLEQMNRSLESTQRELSEVKNRPVSSGTTIIRAEPAPIPAPITTTTTVYTRPPSSEAISRLGVVNVYFDSGRSNVKSQFYGQLDQVVNLLNQYSDVRVNLTGYTDKSGNQDANLRLSKKRSDAVSSYLKNRGISASRITSNHLGESQSGSENDPFSRRVEIILNHY